MDFLSFGDRPCCWFDLLLLYVCFLVISCTSATSAENGGGKPFYYQDENGRVMEVRRTGFTLPPVKRECECYCLIAGDEATIHCCVECHVTDSVCFPASAYVTGENGNVIKMNDLEVGDTILTVSASGTTERTKVLGFLTYNPEVIGAYVRLTTKSGATLLLSRSHLIYVSNTNRTQEATPRYAGDVTAGEHLLVRRQGELVAEVVTTVDREAHRGAYVPLTAHGTLLVNDVMVSSYAAFPHDVAHGFMAPLRWFPLLTSYTTPTDGDHPYVTFLKALGDVIMPDRRYKPSRIAEFDRSSDTLYRSVGDDVTQETLTRDLRET